MNNSCGEIVCINVINDPDTTLEWKLIESWNMSSLMEFLNTNTSFRRKRQIFEEHEREKREEMDGEIMFEGDMEYDEVGNENVFYENYEDSDEDNNQWTSIIFKFNPLNFFNLNDEIFPQRMKEKLFKDITTFSLNIQEWNTFALMALNFIDKILFRNNSKLKEINNSICVLAIKLSFPIAKTLVKTMKKILTDSQMIATGHIHRPIISYETGDENHNEEETQNYFVPRFEHITLVSYIDEWTITVEDYL